MFEVMEQAEQPDVSDKKEYLDKILWKARIIKK